MLDPGPPFAMVYVPSPPGELVVLRAALHADVISVVFADELQRLRATDARGDLVVFRPDTATIILRQPIRAIDAVEDDGAVKRDELPEGRAGEGSRG